MILHTIINENEIFCEKKDINNEKIGYIDKNNIYFEIKFNKIDNVISTNPKDYLKTNNQF